MSDPYMGYSLSCSPILFALSLQLQVYTLKPFSLVPVLSDIDALVHVNPSSTNLLKEVTVNDMGMIEYISRLTILFATNSSFNNLIMSTIQLLIQRLYSLPVPYSTQRSVTVDTYTASSVTSCYVRSTHSSAYYSEWWLSVEWYI